MMEDNVNENNPIQDEPENFIKHSKSCWRYGENEALYSDWTIILENRDRIETYHVHRVFNGTLSEYFKTIFTMPKELQEHHTHTSRVSLCDGQMDVFPFLLDYLYGVYDDLKPELPYPSIIGRGIVALLSLARYFNIQNFIDDTEECIMSINSEATCRKRVGDLSKCEFVTFLLADAVIYSEEEMVKVLLGICSKVYSSGNSYERSTIMRYIPDTMKQKVVEHSEIHGQRNYDTLMRGIINKHNSGMKKIKADYEESRGYYIVSGAGVESVNGKYYHIGVDENSPIYSKISGTNNHGQSSALVRSRYLDSWCIVTTLSAYLKNVHSDHSNDNHLYAVHRRNIGGYAMRWISNVENGNAMNPAPTVVFKSFDGSDMSSSANIIQAAPTSGLHQTNVTFAYATQWSYLK